MPDVMNIRAANLQLGPCVACGKQRYKSRRAARKASKDLHPDARMQAYQCGDYWHIGRAFFPSRAAARRASRAPRGGGAARTGTEAS